MILGETGTSKESAARLVHEKSGRHGPLVTFNCATTPKDMTDGELFGHARGAFTGAINDHPGLFEQADGGTLFLDEIGEMPAEMQAKLLRAVQEGEVRRLGESRARKVNVRIVAATHCDLKEMVKQGRFRDDLRHRLKGYTVSLPPLRERGRDAVLLARTFLSKDFPSKRLSLEAEAALLRYLWPGNVRELQNVIRAAAIDAGRTISADHLAPHLDEPESISAAADRSEQILAVVDRLGAASPEELRAETGLTRTTLRRALAELIAAEVLVAVGEGRGTRYARPASPLDDVVLTARQQFILQHVREAGRITRLQCAERANVSPRTASRELAALVELGLLVPDGKNGNGSGYTPA